jgi:alkylation response protein AidB-like acyl-CoA dehydrogenase
VKVFHTVYLNQKQDQMHHHLRTKVERTQVMAGFSKGSKKWITNAGESEFYSVIAQGDPSLGSKGITAFVVEKSDPRCLFWST